MMPPIELLKFKIILKFQLVSLIFFYSRTIGHIIGDLQNALSRIKYLGYNSAAHCQQWLFLIIFSTNLVAVQAGPSKGSFAIQT